MNPRHAGSAGIALALALGLFAAGAQAGTYGPGPEGFSPVGRFVFRNEAEAIARRVAATRALAEPVNVVEIHVEQTSMTPGGRGWSVVVVGKIEGGCHAVTVGIAADDGRVYAVGDRRAVPTKAPPDCERWYILGAEGATATLDTAAVSTTPGATAAAAATTPGSGAARVRTLTREEASAIAGDAATKKGYRETEILMAEFRPGTAGGGGRWRVDVLGATEKGCGVYKVELAEPVASGAGAGGAAEWTLRYQNNLLAGKKVQVGECRDWYAAKGKVDDPADWIPGKVLWDVVDSYNRQ